jgi:hypothetical protein
MQTPEDFTQQFNAWRKERSYFGWDLETAASKWAYALDKEEAKAAYWALRSINLEHTPFTREQDWMFHYLSKRATYSSRGDRNPVTGQHFTERYGGRGR